MAAERLKMVSRERLKEVYLRLQAIRNDLDLLAAYVIEEI